MPEERKLVTILFADTTDSTALGEALDPEDVRALMSRYYDHAQRIIAEHGGTLEKFIGDAVMAVFGLPQAHGDDAERALAAALALFRAVAGDTVLAGRIVLRAGVHIGEVIATTDLARGDFLVTGDAVNVAARLEQTATPGEIVASERTADAARASFLFGAARSIIVKGKSRSLRVFPLTSQRPARQLSHPPLVGRKSDLAQLALLRDRALAERRPQLVSVIAPAGTGKTRLLEEFLARLDPKDGWRVAMARCLPYGQTLTFWPLRGLLEELLGGTFTPEAISDAFAAAGHSQDDADHLAGQVLATLGIEPEGGAERETIFGSWRLLVEALSKQAPRIIVFEDLHWASESLLDLVEHLMQPRTEAALLIAATSRPELLDRRMAWGGGRRSFTALALEPLSDAETRTLVGKLTKAVTKKLPEAAREGVVERAGGNPFFIIELARTLVERSLPGHAASAGTLPDTVQEALQEQLDYLSPPERAALQAAAVVGRTFRPATLQAVLATPAHAEPHAESAAEPVAIDAALDSLLARDLIAPAEERGAFTFRHILIRDVAYGTLSRSERIRLHRAVAAWLEQFAAGRVDEFIELIAYHEREAALLVRQSAVPLAAPVDATRAIHYLERAGELASRAGLFGPAVAHIRAAITLAPTDELLRLYELLGDCAVEGDVAVEGFEHAFSLWRERRQIDPLTGARLLRKLLYVYWHAVGSHGERPSPEDLATLHTEALRLAKQAKDEDELWRVRIAPLNVFYRASSREDLERERDLCAAAVAHFEQRQDWPSLYKALESYASYALWLGAHEEVIVASKRCLEWPDLPVWARGEVVALIAKAYSVRGEYDACLATVRDALAHVRPGEPIGALAEAVKAAADAAYFSGRWSELDGLRQAMALICDEAQQSPGLHVHGLWLGYMPTLVVALAREDRAATDAVAAELERVLVPSHFETPLIHHIIAAYLADDLARFDLDGSAGRWTLVWWPLEYSIERGLAAPARMIQTSREGPHEFSHALADIAEALASGDDARLAMAIDAAEARHLIPLAARMRIVLAQRTGDREPLERARPVLERLGDRQFLRRLDEVAASLG